MPPSPSNSEAATVASAARAWRSPEYWLYGTWALLAAGLLLYSQTLSFTEDEGFHLLAAQLIKGGMRPYLDFCFPQTPLNAYWNAFLMRVGGESWRGPHALAALETCAAAILAAQFVLSRLPERSWRVAGALAVALMIGCNTNVVEFGTLGQAYGICLFTSVCAFRLAVAAVGKSGGWLPFASGIFVGAAAASSLLSAGVAPVLLVWIFCFSHAGGRWNKALFFTTGAAIPFLPVFYLALQSPDVVWFNVVKYHVIFREVYWPEPLTHDLKILTGWLSDSQALLMGLLAVFGAFYISKRSTWSSHQRAEFYLCGWMALAIGAELAIAHPTFSRYFCLLVPFAAILALPGLYALGDRVMGPGKPFWPVFFVSLICIASLARDLCIDRSDSNRWQEYEAATRKLLQVTPPGKQFFAEEQMYFLSKRRPPSGMEFSYSHELKLSAIQLAKLHITSIETQKRELTDGTFASAATCSSDLVEDYALNKIFHQKEDMRGCTVYWDWQPPAPGESNR